MDQALGPSHLFHAVMAANDLTLGMLAHVRLEVIKCQWATGHNNVHILTFTLATFAAWTSVTGLPALFIQENFPLMSAWARQMVDEITTLIGSCAVYDEEAIKKKLTVQELVRFTTAKDSLTGEMARFPLHLESKLGGLTNYMKQLVEKQINAVSELFQELGKELHDDSLYMVANMVAEGSVRCMKGPPERTTLPPSVTHPTLRDEADEEDM